MTSGLRSSFSERRTQERGASVNTALLGGPAGARGPGREGVEAEPSPRPLLRHHFLAPADGTCTQATHVSPGHGRSPLLALSQLVLTTHSRDLALHYCPSQGGTRYPAKLP